MKNTNFWNDARVLQFTKKSTLGQYGNFKRCYTLENKMKVFKKLKKTFKEFTASKKEVTIQDYIKSNGENLKETYSDWNIDFSKIFIYDIGFNIIQDKKGLFHSDIGHNEQFNCKDLKEVEAHLYDFYLGY